MDDMGCNVLTLLSPVLNSTTVFIEGSCVVDTVLGAVFRMMTQTKQSLFSQNVTPVGKTSH